MTKGALVLELPQLNRAIIPTRCEQACFIWVPPDAIHIALVRTIYTCVHGSTHSAARKAQNDPLDLGFIELRAVSGTSGAWSRLTHFNAKVVHWFGGGD